MSSRCDVDILIFRTLRDEKYPRDKATFRVAILINEEKFAFDVSSTIERETKKNLIFFHELDGCVSDRNPNNVIRVSLR